ncbi:amidophosphoribosyltransferase [Alicyclobacillus acidiphilus]|uniref:amidophosphoribosyltransferase n=1 Tax=Alicyclobacillus acidiphilus TaxID=182455 RepID=UPI0008357563|nr:amidophosphoribosyltransferase [Alicyclobacillus acidiphilus]
MREHHDTFDLDADRPHEECGVFGIYGHQQAAALTYYGLVALQHRGQEAAGIASIDGDHMYSHKGLGLLTDVFRDGQLEQLHGYGAIGHVRYSTAGANTIQNAQPITLSTYARNFAIAHNGNLVNAKWLRIQLEQDGSLFQTTADTEVIAHLVAKAGGGNLADAVAQAAKRIEGGFAFLLLGDDELIALRDPLGLRPMVLGKLGDAYVVASESCALETVGATLLRDVEPGELIRVTKAGLMSSRFAERRQRRMCTFEHVYFARPDSDVDGWNVHSVRKGLGKMLAEKYPVDADIVIGVPDSSVSAAAGYAEASRLPLEMGLVKNKYIARTFIQPSQDLRDTGVRLKLNAVRSICEGKRVVLIDDSIVRGTTSRRIVRLLRDAGATEVHVRISSPPYVSPCHYGIDTATADELIAAQMTVEEIRDTIEADSLAFLTVDELMEGFGFPAETPVPFCNACFTRSYPTELVDQDMKQGKSNHLVHAGS